MRNLLYWAIMGLGISFVGGNCQTPNVPPPDASDAAPVPTPPMPPLADSAPPVTGDCMGACATLARFGCVTGTRSDCAVWAARDLGSGKVTNPITHMVLTCDVVSKFSSKADAVAVGFACP